MSYPIRFRNAARADGGALWRLVQYSGTLDLNSPYFYLIFSEFFGSTCLVAEQGDELVGCVIAFRPPEQNDVLFVWQIGVLPAARRQGLGKRMLRALLELPACEGVRCLQATITFDNEASLRLFESFARALGVPCRRTEFFPSHLFPTPHEAEELFSIGPLPDHLPDLEGVKS